MGQTTSPGLEASTPETIVRTALAHRCSGVAFTYNEPIISAEYCLEVAQACHEAGLKTIAVTAGYISGAAREAFFRGMDAANVDLKGFSDNFYRQVLRRAAGTSPGNPGVPRQGNRVWLEVTTLLIPGANDAPAELEALTAWVADNLGQEYPCTSAPSTRRTTSWTAPPRPSESLEQARASPTRMACTSSTWAMCGAPRAAPPSVLAAEPSSWRGTVTG